MRVVSLLGVAVWAVACGGIGSAPADAAAVISSDAMPGPPGSDASPEDGGQDADSGPITIPVADPDSGACVVTPYASFEGIVCFGSDPAPYLDYLLPDAGVAVGQCPKPSDFLPPRGEGSGPCGHLACGPLLPAAVAALLDAGADGEACCFWAVEVCGV